MSRWQTSPEANKRYDRRYRERLKARREQFRKFEAIKLKGLFTPESAAAWVSKAEEALRLARPALQKRAEQTLREARRVLRIVK